MVVDGTLRRPEPADLTLVRDPGSVLKRLQIPFCHPRGLGSLYRHHTATGATSARNPARAPGPADTPGSMLALGLRTARQRYGGLVPARAALSLAMRYGQMVKPAPRVAVEREGRYACLPFAACPHHTVCLGPSPVHSCLWPTPSPCSLCPHCRGLTLLACRHAHAATLVAHPPSPTHLWLPPYPPSIRQSQLYTNPICCAGTTLIQGHVVETCLRRGCL